MSQQMGPRSRTRDTADKLKERFQWLQSFSDDEVSQISFCSPGETMMAEDLYFDISNPERGIIQGEHGVPVPEGSCYVPKSEIPRQLWNKLTGQF